ncbi:MAG: DNA polymerase I, partial [Ignavibacteriales bacterium]|nr:DNA polymerase I [Ignavibacteriales bacterium]
IRAFNLPLLEYPGFEADDVMGTLARIAEQQNILTYLVTSDKDFLQLVSPLIKVYRPGKQGDDDEILDESGVIEKFGVGPERVIDILALTGDSSDNVPGVPGVGPKSAEPLVQLYGTVENIYDHLEDIKQAGLREKLRKNRELAFLSKQLVTIHTQVPVTENVHELKARPKDTVRLLQFYRELEFKSLARRLEEVSAAAAPMETNSAAVVHSDIKTSAHSYIVIDSESAYKDFTRIFRAAPLFVFDTETTSADPLRAELVGLSFCFAPHTAYYLPVSGASAVDQGGGTLFDTAPDPASRASFAVTPEQLAKDLKSVFEDERIKKFGQNIKYDMLVLMQIGIFPRGIAFDTMIASYLLRSDGKHSLDALAAEHLNYRMVSFDELTENGRKDIRTIPVHEVGAYSAEDADITFQLGDILHNRMGVAGMRPLCDDIEFPLISVLATMEHTGVRIDVPFLASMSKQLEQQLTGLIHAIHEEAGEQFNINSTQQLAAILFDKLNLRKVRKTKTGYSTDVSVLESLQGEHPIIDRILEYRQLSKLKSTYVDALPRLIHPGTRRLHTSFNQAVAATGRLSSSDPNLQNIPIRTEVGRSIRKAFIPGSPDMLILSADYSQIELRVMAHIADDAGLQEAFKAGEDIHTSTAARVFGIPAAEVTKEMRRKAKEVNFGIMYGIGAYGLATRLEIPQTDAKDIIARYFERFPGVNNYIAKTIAQARHDGYVSTLSGRRRYIADINNKNANIRGNAERQAINMPIQGTAADMIKRAMIDIQREFESKKLRSRMLLQVHDELVFEVHKKEVEDVRQTVLHLMKSAFPLSVPLEVEVGIGENWLEAH